MRHLPVCYNRSPVLDARVSDEDFELLNQFAWKLSTSTRVTPRAAKARTHLLGSAGVLHLHQAVGMLVIHGKLAEVALTEALNGDCVNVLSLRETLVRIIPEDGDYLNCERENLRPSLAYRYINPTSEVELSPSELRAKREWEK